MIVKSIFKRIISINICLSYSNPSKPRLQYEQFFRTMQKSNSISQTINHFQKYSQSLKDNHKLISVTLRLITRNMKYCQKQDFSLVKSFVTDKMHQLKNIDFISLEAQDIKNIVLFLVSYHQNCSTSPSQMAIIKRYLKRFIELYKHSQVQHQISNLPILLSLIPFVQLNYAQFYEEYITQAIQTINQHQKEFLRQGLTFLNILKVCETTYSNTNVNLQAFIEKTALKISMKPLQQVFQQNTLIQIWIIFQRLTLRCQNTPFKLINVKKVIYNIQKLLISRIYKINGRNFQILIPNLLKFNKNCSFLKQYFTFVGLSINLEGETCLNPLFFVQSISFLKRQDAFLLNSINPNWQSSFIALLHRYYNKDSQFVRRIDDYLQMILMNDTLQYENSIKLLDFYNNQYHNFSGQTILANITNSIQKIKINRKYFQEQIASNLLLDLNQKIQRISLNREQYVQFSQFIFSNLIQFQKSQNKRLSFLSKNRQQINQISLNKYQLRRLLIIDLTVLLLNLTYNSLKHQDILSKIKDYNNLMRQYKDQFLIKIFFQLQIPKQHFGKYIQLLVCIYQDVSCHTIQMVLFKNIYSKISESLVFNYYSLQFIHHFYYTYSKQNYYKLIFTNNFFFRQFYSIHRKCINKYIFESLNKIPRLLNRYIPILYDLIQIYQQQKFSPQESYELFNSILSNLDKRVPLELFQILIQFAIKNDFQRYNNVLINLSLAFSKLSTQNIYKKYPYLQNWQEKSNQNSNQLKNFICNYSKSLVGRQNLHQDYFFKQLDNCVKSVNEITTEESFNLVTSIIEMVIAHHLWHKYNKTYGKMLDPFLHKLIQYSKQNNINQKMTFRLLKVLINTNCLCNYYGQDQIHKLFSCQQIIPTQLIIFLSIIPIYVRESIILQNIMHFKLNSHLIMRQFCLIYLRIEAPSEKMVKFMQEIVKRHQDDIPQVMKIYLSPANNAIKSLKARLKYTLTQQSISIGEANIKLLFHDIAIECNDFYDLDHQVVVQGCHKIIIRKIFRQLFPDKIVQFLAQKQKDQSNRFFKTSKFHS